MTTKASLEELVTKYEKKIEEITLDTSELTGCEKNLDSIRKLMNIYFNPEEDVSQFRFGETETDVESFKEFNYKKGRMPGYLYLKCWVISVKDGKADQFSNLAEGLSSSIDRYIYSTKYFYLNRDNDAKWFVNLSNRILEVFPGLMDIRLNMIKYLKVHSQTHSDIIFHTDEGKKFDPAFDKNETIKQKEYYGTIPLESYLERVWTEFKNLKQSNLHNFLIFSNYFYDYEIDNKEQNLRGDNDNITPNISGSSDLALDRATNSLFGELDLTKKGLIERFNEHFPIQANEDIADIIAGYKREYIDKLDIIGSYTRILPEIINSIQHDYRNVIFPPDINMPLMPVNKFKDLVTSCISNLDNIKKYEKNKEILRLIERYKTLEEIKIASSALLFLAKEDKYGVYQDIWRNNKIKARELESAIMIYPTISPLIKSETRDIYLNNVQRYETEVGLILEYAFSTNKTICEDKINKCDRLDYILGSEHDLDIKSKKEMILERNALKIGLGVEKYFLLMKNLFGNFGKLQGFSNIDDNQLKIIKKFLCSFNNERIPIHEMAMKVISKNPTFMVEVDLGSILKLTTFTKLYNEDNATTKDDSSFEREITERLNCEELKIPQCISSANIGGYHVNMFPFLDGDTLYAHLNKKLSQAVYDQELIVSYFKNAIEQLVAIHKKANELVKEGKLTLNEIVEEESTFFSDEVKKRLGEGGINEEITDRIYNNFTCINKYLTEITRIAPSYYKDSNPRNIIISNNEVFHIDFEYKDRLAGEIDLVKLLRNGLDYTGLPDIKYLTRMDNEEDGQWNARKNSMAKRLEDFRYITPAKEEELRTLYSKGRYGDDVNDAEANKKYDFAAVYIHIFYTGWYSMKKLAGIPERAKEISKNRSAYHLLEAKVMLEHIINDGTLYSKEGIDINELGRLRKALDEIG